MRESILFLMTAAAFAADGDWTSYGKNNAGWRYSELKEGTQAQIQLGLNRLMTKNPGRTYLLRSLARC